MKIACLKNHPVEGPGLIADWARIRGVVLEVIEAQDLSLGELTEFDSLIVMGGPMSVHDRSHDPLVERVMEATGDAFRAGKPILGICLGAQMLAMVAGGGVVPGSQKEIGWYPVEFTGELESPFSGETESLVVFHWHGEQIVAPKGAEVIARTEVCPVQAFRMKRRQWGLQFHLEVAAESVEEMTNAFRTELDAAGPGVATATEIRTGVEEFGSNCREVLFRFLDAWAEEWGSDS